MNKPISITLLEALFPQARNFKNVREASDSTGSLNGEVHEARMSRIK